MATVNFPVPDDEQSGILWEMSMDPKEFTVVSDNEDTLWLKHYTTGNEVMIQKNRRVKRDSQ